MKIDIEKTLKNNEKRVLSAFSEAFLSLIVAKSFKKITVNEICETAEYPRATFYNYFEDKYDLLNFFWFTIAEMIKPDENNTLSFYERMVGFFNNLYDLFECHEDNFIKIFENNVNDDYFLYNCKLFISDWIKNKLKEIYLPERTDTPLDILAEHYANALYLVIEWRFIKGNNCSREQSLSYLKYLLPEI